ncbi:MAG: fasciclin domain-containing protein [Anaerolineae bacterium]
MSFKFNLRTVLTAVAVVAAALAAAPYAFAQTIDAAGITITETDTNTLIYEAGNADTFSVVLDEMPSDDVTIDFTLSAGQLGVSPTQLTFTMSDWDQPQEVVVFAPNDGLVEGQQANPVDLTASSSDGNYDGLTASLDVYIRDNLAVNASFEDTISGEWNLIGGASVFDAGLGVALEGTDVLLINGGSGPRGAIQNVTGLAGVSGDVVTFDYYIAGQNIPSGGVIAAQITTFDAGLLVDRELCQFGTRGTFNFSQDTCALTATAAFDEVEVGIGQQNLGGGLLAFDGLGLGVNADTSLTIAEIAVANGFDNLVAALNETGLTPIFGDPGSYTVFAPDDQAFEDLATALGFSDAADLVANVDEDVLARILRYHVLGSEVLLRDVPLNTDITTDLGRTFQVTTSGPDIVIPFTSGNVSGQATIVLTDIVASNGVIHVVDTVLLPPTIVDVAAATPDLSILVTAVVTAGLDTVLNDNLADFTVFAPTDTAFANLLAEFGITQQELLNAPQLDNVLLYHVVDGTVLSTDLSDDLVVTTLEGEDFAIQLDSGTQIEDARDRFVTIGTTDIETINGVVHLLTDNVLVPQDPNQP